MTACCDHKVPVHMLGRGCINCDCAEVHSVELAEYQVHCRCGKHHVEDDCPKSALRR